MTSIRLFPVFFVALCLAFCLMGGPPAQRAHAGGGALAVIEGRQVGNPPPPMANAAEAAAKARAAVMTALGQDGALRSEGPDRPPECLRSFTWDHLFGTSLLAVAGEHEAVRAIAALLARQNADGSWPVMVCVDASGAGIPAPGPSQTAFAVALLAGLAHRGHPAIDLAIVRPRLQRALQWMETVWLADPAGAFGVAPGDPQASTEGTALALMAAIELERLFPGCCRQRAVAAAQLLTNRLWRGDHFARGLNTAQIDDDQTGPHTHQSLAVLALVEAARVYPGETPDPTTYDPIPWLKAHFTRTALSAGRQVDALGDRLVLADAAGLLYGCDGGQLGAPGAPSALTCPRGALRRADPNPHNGGCYSPYDACAEPVDALPADTTVVQSANSEITLLAALAAMALARAEDTAFLLNGGLALQRPSGAVIAIAGPPLLQPGRALLYPLNHRKRQYGYTALLGLALQRLNPFALGTGHTLAAALPSGLHFPQDRFDPREIAPTALLLDPPSGLIDASTPDAVTIAHQARPEGWVRTYTDIAEDRDWPAACYRLNYRLSGEGWPDYELKVVDRRTQTHGAGLQLTHGLRLNGILAGAPRELSIPLQTLARFWPRDLDAEDAPFIVSGLEHVQDDTAPGATLNTDVQLHLTDLRLVAGDCLEGSPPLLRFAHVAVDGQARPFAAVEDVEWAGRPALRVDFALQSPNNRWQRVIAHDRWRWSCAETLVVHYAAAQPTRIQLVLEDAQIDGTTGARWFAETTLEASASWRTWTVSVAELRRFDSQDRRSLVWDRLRQVALTIIPGTGTAEVGTLYLDTVEALAPAEALGPNGTCLLHRPPSANAGLAQMVDERTPVTLDGSKSSDPERDALTFAWEQSAGPSVTLSNPTSAQPTFTAPEVTANTVLTFQLVVNDGTVSSAPATVDITVRNIDPPPTANQTSSGGGGGGCTFNPGAEFDPLILEMTGLLFAYLLWQRLRKRSLS